MCLIDRHVEDVKHRVSLVYDMLMVPEGCNLTSRVRHFFHVKQCNTLKTQASVVFYMCDASNLF